MATLRKMLKLLVQLNSKKEDFIFVCFLTELEIYSLCFIRKVVQTQRPSQH